MFCFVFSPQQSQQKHGAGTSCQGSASVLCERWCNPSNPISLLKDAEIKHVMIKQPPDTQLKPAVPASSWINAHAQTIRNWFHVNRRLNQNESTTDHLPQGSNESFGAKPAYILYINFRIMRQGRTRERREWVRADEQWLPGHLVLIYLFIYFK